MTGKEKCEFLRTIRVNMAAKNGIPYTPKECTHKGDCLGTCPLCEYETKVLMEEIRKKTKQGETIITDTDSIIKLEQISNKQEIEPQRNYEALSGNVNKTPITPKMQREWEIYKRALSLDIFEEELNMRKIEKTRRRYNVNKK